MTIQSNRSECASEAGMTLMELSVLIVLLMLLVGMAFIGARGWMRGSDRIGCIMNISKTQKAVRFLASANGLAPGTDAAALPRPIDLQGQLVGDSGYLASTPRCPGKGTYTFGGDRIPEPGELYLSCSLGVSGQHVPTNYQGW